MKISNELIASLREDYRSASLSVEDIHEQPLQQFSQWLEEALKSEVKEPNAMTIATVDEQGQPSARIVLLKGFSEKGLVFYTNYQSKKGLNLAKNPKIAAVFFWLELERQVRIEGVAEKIAEEDSLKYFQSRPKGSQIGAWASPQSQVISDRQVLEKEVALLQKKFADQKVLPLPPNWGGYQILPHKFEFWQGRSSRLHDRIQYRLENNQWKIERLAP